MSLAHPTEWIRAFISGQVGNRRSIRTPAGIAREAPREPSEPSRPERASGAPAAPGDGPRPSAVAILEQGAKKKRRVALSREDALFWGKRVGIAALALGVVSSIGVALTVRHFESELPAIADLDAMGERAGDVKIARGVERGGVGDVGAVRSEPVGPYRDSLSGQHGRERVGIGAARVEWETQEVRFSEERTDDGDLARAVDRDRADEVSASSADPSPSNRPA